MATTKTISRNGETRAIKITGKAGSTFEFYIKQVLIITTLIAKLLRLLFLYLKNKKYLPMVNTLKTLLYQLLQVTLNMIFL